MTLIPGGGTEWADGQTNVIEKALSDGDFTVTASSTVPQGESIFDVSDQVKYTYESGNTDVATVDGGGKVTITGAGTAVITVTAVPKAAENANINGTSVTYTVQVGRYTPAIDLSGYDGSEGSRTYTASFTGRPIAGGAEGYEKAEFQGVQGIDPTGGLTYTFYTDAACETPLVNSEDGNIPIAVDVYYLKVTYDGADDPNYESAESEVITVHVTRASVGADAVQAEDYTGPYSGQTDVSLREQCPVTVEGFTEDQYTVQYAQSATEPAADAIAVWQETVIVKDVADSSSGTAGQGNHYWYMVTFADGNYEPVIGELQVTIAPKELTFTENDPAIRKTYDSTTAVPEGSLDGLGLSTGITGESFTVAVSGIYGDVNAGTGKAVTITYSLTESGSAQLGNYAAPGSSTPLSSTSNTVEQELNDGVIEKKEVAITGITATDKVYDGGTDVELEFANAEISELASGDSEATVQINIAAITGTVESAGVDEDKAVTITSTNPLTGSAAGNYTVTDYNEVTVTITAATPTLAFEGVEGNALSAPYTGQPIRPVSVLLSPIRVRSSAASATRALL